MCGDYRLLNNVTKWDAYPLPNVQDFANHLHGCAIFSTIDLVKAYHQIPVNDEDIEKTAITTPIGLFEYVRTPFGLKNAGQTFQRMMNEVTRGLNNVYVDVDDVLVASPNFATYLSDLRALFNCLKEFGMVVNADKSTFARAKVKFLGYQISSAGSSARKS